MAVPGLESNIAAIHADRAARDEKVHQGFLRQRRNIFAGSTALVLIQLLDIKFKQISILGNVAAIDDSAAVVCVAWVFWAYWLFRFSVYSSAIEDGYINEMKSKLEKIYLKNIALKRAKQKLNRSKAVPSSAILLEIDGGEGRWSKQGRRFVITTKWKFGVKRNTTVSSSEQQIYVTPAQVQRSRVGLYFHLTFRTYWFSEYVLPFVVASFPVVIQVFTFFWGGNVA